MRKISLLTKPTLLKRYIRYIRFISKTRKARNIALKAKLKNKISFDMEAMYNVDKVRDLYKKLAVLCHPDKFVNTSNHEIAEELFQRVTVNKVNFTILTQLKEEIETKLY